uniref:Uncharacterized protein n=2 Tax=Clytia hemisphaerica TaxID=252671 RepID=A0A7M5X3E6_9CNID
EPILMICISILKIHCSDFEIIKNIDETKCETATQEMLVNSTTECLLECRKLQTDNALMTINSSCFCTFKDCSKDKKEGSLATFYRAKRLSIIENVCFQAKESYGIIKIPRSGAVNAFKLVHVSGAAKCGLGSTSNWGCLPNFSTNYVCIVLADDKGKKIAPPGAVSTGYVIVGADVTSKVLNLSLEWASYEVTEGQELRLYHSEVFFHDYYDDNVGSHCVDVILSFDEM